MDNTYLYAIVEHFLDDDDEESTVCRQIINVGQFLAFQAVDRADVVKIEGYVENIVPRYPPDQFRNHFRISRDAFDIMLNELRPHLTMHMPDIAGDNIPAEKQLLMLCWYMANQDCFRQIAHQFNVAVSTVHAVIHRVLDTFTQHMRHVSSPAAMSLYYI